MNGVENVILESNSVLEFVRPDLDTAVLAPAVADFKASALRYLERADAVVMMGKAGAQSDWKSVSLPGIERFRLIRRTTVRRNSLRSLSRNWNGWEDRLFPPVRLKALTAISWRRR